ncbi:MAG: Asp-tRNA(Asn)/Glu-tRNA(Gln) amidotransferase subunit GatC [Myxococcales bacterium]|nr:Asp-tRNA(Asn)/Glu-tRNA(Gln) amidotransferase subunit GatC [Myxococcales bacterium]
MATIDDAEIGRLARLANIALADEEVAPLRADLERIVGYVTSLSEVDTTEVASLAAARVATPLAEDAPRPSLPREAALAAAPATTEGGFAVPHCGE